MKETLIFSYINQFSLVRELALRGISTLGYRVLNNKELVIYINQKRKSVSSARLIDNNEKACIYNKFIVQNEYFKGSSFEDAKSLSETVDSIRELIEENENDVLKLKLTNSTNSKEKYEAIYDIYTKYIEYLDDNNLTDIIREEREIIKSNYKIDNEILNIEEEDISPLTLKLLNTCFTNVHAIKYTDLYNVKQKPVDLQNLYKTKGFVHEIGNVFRKIYDLNKPFDTCTIVCTKISNFYNSIKEFSKLFNIPVIFTDGIPAVEYNAYRLLYLLIKHHDNLYGYDTLKEMLYDYSFNLNRLVEDLELKDEYNKFIRVVGDLKFSFDPVNNDKIFNDYSSLNHKYIDSISKYKDILNKGLVNFLNDYTVLDDDLIKTSLIKDIELYRRINDKDDFDYLKSLITRKITSSSCKEGCITVCSLSKVLENIRDNMFFVGNDSESFHISLAENTFISDSKLLEISRFAKTSLKQVEIKKNNYSNILRIAQALDVNMYVSYTELDETELKKHNFISLLFILNKESHKDLTFDDFKKSFVQANAYTGNNLLSEEEIIKSYLNKNISVTPNELLNENEKKISDLLDDRYSPTEIEEGLKCKRKFLISRILKVSDPEEYDVFKKFENYDLGNMFHDAMQYANDKTKTLSDVLAKASKIFDKTCSMRNPILKYELNIDKDNFLRLVENGFEYLRHKKQGDTEEAIIGDLEINNRILHLSGRPDLVTADEVIDYKTKKTITHIENDNVSCIQALIYALLKEEKSINHVEYYYPHFRKAISTKFVKADVEVVLDTFMTMLSDSDFKPVYLENEDKEKLKQTCKYCKFSDICGKDEYERNR